MKKKLLILLVSVLAAFVLAGCAGASDANSSADTANDTATEAAETTEAADETSEATNDSAASGEKMKVSVAAQPNSGQVFQYLADAHGFLDDENLEVEMVYINNGTDAFQALTGEQVDILSTYGTGSPLLQIASGQDFNIFGGYMIIGETPCYGKPETEWTDLNSFVGKKIGITRFGTPDVVLKGILYDAGILDQVEFVEFKKNQEVLQAIANGEVDFGATATGYQLQARDLGLEIKMWPDEYWKNHSCCRMVARSSMVEDSEGAEKLYHLLRAYLRAEEYLQGHEDEAIDLVVSNLDLDRDTVESFVKSPHMKYDTDPFKNSVVKMWDKMTDFGYIDATDVDVTSHINTEIYKKALDSLIEEYPDSAFFTEKLAQFEENNS